MKPTLCSRCKKNLAVIFITKIDGGKTVNEGLCLKCAKEMGIKPVDDMIERMGLSEDDLENLNGEMTEAMNGLEGLLGQNQSDDDEADENDSQTATFPFLNKLFGAAGQDNVPAAPEPEKTESRQRAAEKPNGSKNKKHKFLDTYCQNLTQKARDGKLDHIIGREEELERVIQILNRRQKNNPCLIGEPGVGKTAIAEGLAQKIAAKDVPYKLQNKEVYLMDLTALVAGTQFRGQFESRMKGLIEEVKKLGNIILVIDEVHNLVGAGDAEGSMNAANILKPALSRGEIQVIGATTFNEYRKHIEKDAALERRFQPVTVNEPNIEDTLKILQGIAHYYEQFHGVAIPQGVLRQAVLLSERYITDRYLPDKAIDLIDEAASRVRLRAFTAPPDLKKLEDEVKRLDEEKKAAVNEQDFERAAEVRDREAKVREERKKAQVEWEDKTEKIVNEIGVEDIADVVSMTTGVPVSNLTEAETEKLLRMESVLHERVIGQEEAVTALSKAIRRSRSGLKDPKRPAGSFIFLGPSGVGKTELSKTLAEFLFNSQDALISFDMSEYMEKHTVSRLIGSPPGYVGYDEGGQLTTAVRQRPYSVVLFDEIEKAHPDVFNILLQILEEGRLTDAQGRMVDFRNTVIIMTSNVGAREITTTAPLGFSSSGATGLNDDEIKTRVMSEVKRLFRPEFLNRIDEIIVFKSLTEDEIVEIVNLMVADLRDRLIEQNMTINMSDAANRLIAKEGTDLSFGARPLRRAIQRLLEDPISEQILEGKWTSGSVIDVDVEDEKLVFNQGTGSIPAPRKRDTIAQEAELILSNYDLGRAGLTYSGSGRGGSSGDSAAD